MSTLSVLVPSRNEMFLQKTLETVLGAIRGDTEIICVLDGYWPDPGFAPHDRVTLIHRPESIGQRAATNEAARVSRSDYIMKLDAHCDLAEGFDVVLMDAADELDSGVMQVPAQYNLHAFDWVCPCGGRRYQGKQRTCPKCSGPMEREVIWKPRRSRYTTAWRFDPELHFQYWGKWKHTEDGRRELAPTMSMLGACWFVSRERFWEIDGLDERHGGWGQMGTELAAKQWLSGSELICNKRTWFAHMFRTQGADFGFPYPLSKAATRRAQRYSQDLWRNGKWPKATRPLSWMLERFAPVQGWEESHVEDQRQRERAAGGGGDDRSTVPILQPAPTPDRVPRPGGAGRVHDGRGLGPGPGDGGVPPGGVDPILSKGVVYYSDCRGDEEILAASRACLGAAVNGHEIVSSCLGPVPFGDVRIEHATLARGYLTMFRQILAGLELSRADIVFLCEHDVLYPREHFAFTPPDADRVFYNEHVWKVDADTGRGLHYRTRQTSGLCAYRSTLLEHYRRRVALVEARGFSRRMGFEPGTHGRAERVDDLTSESWWSERPLVDIRHGHNLTPNRWRKDQFRNTRSCKGWTEADEVPGWGVTKGRFREFLREAVA